MKAIAYRFSSDSALQALIDKVESLISAVRSIAENAASTASSALSTAQTAQAMTRYHGTCSTAAATVAKVVTCSGFTRETGSRVAVKFTYANTASSPSLNVNGTGAAAIYLGGAAAVSGCWAAGEVCLFEFDGTYWNLLKSKPVSSFNDISGTLPITKGGTGATTAAAARTALGITPANIGAAASSHSHTLASCTGTLAVSKGGTGATTAAAALAALGGATMTLYTCSVTTSSWSTNSSGGFRKTITVSGIKSTDVPVVGVQMSSDVSSATAQGQAFACINRITTANNSITCYAFNSAPTTAITLQLLVVRAA